jgi:dTDP-4-amino-4,6-dideoxygalactose transaminase
MRVDILLTFQKNPNNFGYLMPDKGEKNMNVPFVDLSRQFNPLMADFQAAIKSVIDRCAFINGPEVKEFEKRMAKHQEIAEVCAVSNCTHALYLTLKALGVGEGDEVITAPNTAFPTSEAIQLAGAAVAFVDIAPGTFALDPQAAEQAISSKTKAIIPVHLYGIPVDMDAFTVLGEKHDLFIIEDVAQAQGARYKGRRAGSIGKAGCFSFFPSKNLGAFGDGGAVASADVDLIKSIRMMANHGREDKYTHQIFGTNSRLDTLKAAQLAICLEYLDAWNQERRNAAQLYRQLLEPFPEIIRPQVPADCEAIWHVYVIRYKQRAKLAAFLNERGIKTGLHYPLPLHLQPVYSYLDMPVGSLPEAEAACREVLSLPMFPKITPQEVETVAGAIGQFLRNS